MVARAGPVKEPARTRPGVTAGLARTRVTTHVPVMPTRLPLLRPLLLAVILPLTALTCFAAHGSARTQAAPPPAPAVGTAAPSGAAPP